MATNCDTGQTLWEAWLAYVNKTYDPLWLNNGFWVAGPGIRYKAEDANECINFFLKHVGGLKMCDLDMMKRISSLEAKLDKLCGDHLDTQGIAQKNKDALDELHKKEQVVELCAPAAAAALPKLQRLETVKTMDTPKRSPKRKKPNDDADGDTSACAVDTQDVPKPSRAPLLPNGSTGYVQAAMPSWTTVVRRKPRMKTVTGTRESSSLLGGTGVVELVVSGIRRHQQGSSEDHISMLKDYVEENGIAVNDGDITLLTKDPTKRTLAFKLTVDRDEKEKVFDGKFWPSFVYVRKFIPQKSLSVKINS